MKYFAVIILVTFLGLLLPVSSGAAPAYGTRLPEKFHLVVGGQTYVVKERQLSDNNGEINSLQHFLLLSFGITDWLSLDLKGGAGDIEHDQDGGNKIQYPAYVGGGYGFRIKLYDDAKIKSVFGFQHISIHPYSVFIGPTKNKSVLDDWQLSLLGSYDLKLVTPYAGVKWSRMDYIHWTDDDRNRKQSDWGQFTGLITGVDVPLGKSAWVNVEGQFLDSRALAVSLNYQF